MEYLKTTPYDEPDNTCLYCGNDCDNTFCSTDCEDADYKENCDD